MSYNDFVERRISFISEFLNSTRPASELADFMKAFDIMLPHDGSKSTYNQCDELPKDTSEPIHAEDAVPESKPTQKRKRGFARKIVTINDGTKMNIHPASKMVKVSFFDRDTFYGSITAAASALGVSSAAVSKAIKKRGLVNGHSVKFVNMSELKSAPKND